MLHSLNAEAISEESIGSDDDNQPIASSFVPMESTVVSTPGSMKRCMTFSHPAGLVFNHEIDRKGSTRALYVNVDDSGSDVGTIEEEEEDGSIVRSVSFGQAFDSSEIPSATDFHVRHSPQTIKQATIDCVPDQTQRHVIIAGNLNELATLISTLRLRVHGEIKSVILLGLNPPSLECWKKICWFKDVFYFRGSATDQGDLKLVKVQDAARILLLAPPLGGLSGSSSEFKRIQEDSIMEVEDKPFLDNETLIDSETVLAVCSVKSMDKAKSPTCELHRTRNIQFINSRRSLRRGLNRIDIESDDVQPIDEEFMWSDAFAAGKAFSGEMLHSIIPQLYYNPYVGQIVSQLLGEVQTSADFTGEVFFHAQNSVHFTLVPVPEKYWNAAYGTLVSFLIRHGMLPLGLQRAKEVFHTGMRFVHTNPSSEVRLHKKDRVMVLLHDFEKIHDPKFWGGTAVEENMI
eukprot:TRINITY_DN16878_c0_g2_i1.p1 TRINITY_DN16878_c0_g2~~TRINITY_DN16878_c0_g2_i1.p1  ORF type:complete len:494 (-),score=141.44 TRINITY_DN16878_c0_g2_i1:717-2096(-)